MNIACVIVDVYLYTCEREMCRWIWVVCLCVGILDRFCFIWFLGRVIRGTVEIVRGCFVKLRGGIEGFFLFVFFFSWGI